MKRLGICRSAVAWRPRAALAGDAHDDARHGDRRKRHPPLRAVRILGLFRYVWAAPATVLGLALAVLALSGGVAVFDGVIEAHGPLLRWALTRLALVHGGVAAITFGHVVLGRDAQSLDWTRSHERVHVRQYERWGLFLLPAYVGASLWALARGGHAYFDNPFEREARAKAST